MTFQPPPPPPGDNPPPPPPPPAQWGPPPGGGGGQPFNPSNVNPLDWGIIGAGFLAFIFSFFDWYTLDIRGFGSGGESAWNGFFGWFAVLCALAAAGLVAMEIFAPQVKLPWPNRVVGLALFALATLCMILALFIFPEDVPDIAGVDKGRGFGFWAALVVIIAGLVLSLMRVQQTGTKLPGALGNLPNIGAKGPQGGIGGQQNPPPPPGYGPPPSP